MWTEQTDDMSLMVKIEPRLSAFAERMWRGEVTGSWREAESRLVEHRERLVSRGVGADAMVPGWCSQHQGECLLWPVDSLNRTSVNN